MKFKIISGEFEMSIDRGTPREAAFDAISLWHYKQDKPKLASIVTVVGPEKTEVYLSTSALMDDINI